MLFHGEYRGDASGQQWHVYQLTAVLMPYASGSKQLVCVGQMNPLNSSVTGVFQSSQLGPLSACFAGYWWRFMSNLYTVFIYSFSHLKTLGYRVAMLY